MRLLLIICFCGLAFGSAISSPTRKLDTVPSDSPLSWIHTRDSTKVNQKSAIRVSDQAIGDIAASVRSTVELVSFSDRDPFGESLSKRLVWLVTYSPVVVTRADSSDTTTINIIVAVAADDATLLEAFTPATIAWPAPFESPRDPETMPDHWNISTLGDIKLDSTIPEVLAEIWQQFGESPKEAGQIIMRPRNVDLELPARRENGRLIPVYEPAARWVVHVMGIFACEMHPPPMIKLDGTVVPPKEEEIPYFTGRLTLVDDQTCSYMMAICTD